ncbi:UBX domain-containing protein 1-like isoform X3 [Camellia sinensis]|uniref:UBX domain-containing protein 1-like isoform X3 n=2 Tax=Camellia sinensis TaxID=4442 RepID=UPI001036215D|nr:UBX domain-containing protein 1-like isoform X3 [Camellia sinensis]
MSEMVVPEVKKRLLDELENMGFPLAQATRGLHYSGNSSIDAAVNWLFDHENDPDIDQMPLVPVPINIEAYDPSYITEQVKLKAQELRDRACGKKEEEETKVEREREKDQAHRKKEKEEKKVEREMEKYQARRKKEEEEKKVEREREKVCLRYLERIKAGKELLEAKRIQEENERKRSIALWKAEKEKENRERDKIRQKLQQDKAERRRRLGLPLDDPPSVNNASTLMQKEKNSLPVKSASLPVKSNSLPVVTVTKEEIMRDCLRSLKRNHMDNVTKVRRAFQTLLIYVKNVVKNPNEEKFRKIRFNNPAFQDRVGNMKEGIEFLELCGFERVDEGKFLFLPEDKVDIAVLKSAGNVLDSAITNPFFGLLSSSREDEAFGLGE